MLGDFNVSNVIFFSSELESGSLNLLQYKLNQNRQRPEVSEELDLLTIFIFKYIYCKEGFFECTTRIRTCGNSVRVHWMLKVTWNIEALFLVCRIFQGHSVSRNLNPSVQGLYAGARTHNLTAHCARMPFYSPKD